MMLGDQGARDRIESVLDRNLLVEAGAGSGKTTALVGRMVALIRAGAPAESLVAVTFTRKAAGELRERFQDDLERATRKAMRDGDEAAPLLGTALRDIDRVFMGTIHAFCARLLRERPLEAGLDPAFSELTAPRAGTLAREWWEGWLERLANEGDPDPATLGGLGIRPDQLFDTFQVLNEALDVEFPAPVIPAPTPGELRALRGEFEEILEVANGALPREEPEKGWDPMQTALRTVFFMRRSLDWDDPVVLLDALHRLVSTMRRNKPCIYIRWGPRGAGQDPARRLEARLLAWTSPGAPASTVLDQWLAHRYAPALSFARRGAEEFGRFRQRTGQLTFHDLLLLTARLLRRSPEARREAGGRLRQILVDEFQDTDPLQAEILFLLTSDPEDDPEDPPEAGWVEMTPRPGSLFVVGDPKQSIYRFRRADIALYQQVRDRFDPDLGGMGEVLRLTANFRSLPGVTEVVNEVFERPDRFPPLGTERQASFAPLEPQRNEGLDSAGTWVMEIPDRPGDGKAGGPTEEASTLAGWIAGRVAGGERAPSDFMILTRTKRNLARHARALESWGLPVQVSGARVGLQEEIQELTLVLEALADPGNPIQVTAALTGLFLGVDHPSLMEAVDTGVRLDPRVRPTGAGAAVDALNRLRRWWRRSRTVPADVLVAEILADSGLLPWIVGGELGGVRGGALTYALELIRGSGLDGDTSISGALRALTTGLEDEDWEAPLEPGRTGGVRVMNVHKAKGLEAPVVILADPYRIMDHTIRELVDRGSSMTPQGWVEIGVHGSSRGFDVLARPGGWEVLRSGEEEFEAAEETRLLYVAGTRARDELIVVRARDQKKAAASPWAPFHDSLDPAERGLGAVLEAPPERPAFPGDPAALTREAEELARERTRRSEGGIEVRTVTGLVKGGADDPFLEEPDPEPGGPSPERDGPVTPVYLLSRGDATGPGGADWGSAVHAVLEAAARGAGPGELTSLARSALIERDRPVQKGEPEEIEILLATVERVRSSELWERASRSRRRLIEHPFLVEWEPGVLLEGVVDLLFQEEDGWVLVDYKTDRDDAAFAKRRPRYEAQLAHYARAWERLTGDPVKETLIFRVT